MAKKEKIENGERAVKLLEDIQRVEGGRIVPKGTILIVTPEKEAELIESKQAEKIK